MTSIAAAAAPGSCAEPVIHIPACTHKRTDRAALAGGAWVLNDQTAAYGGKNRTALMPLRAVDVSQKSLDERETVVVTWPMSSYVLAAKTPSHATQHERGDHDVVKRPDAGQKLRQQVDWAGQPRK